MKTAAKYNTSTLGSNSKNSDESGVLCAPDSPCVAPSHFFEDGIQGLDVN
ncbi:hypothetical protein OAE61_04255 [Verrucomicrobiales bacterium]|nr:hypothetical protein [Verrucomicrobiales bacterium]MDC0276002.1 hypothetical protein [Verrucomicrobiales bacterium]